MYFENFSEDLSKCWLLIQILWPYKVKILVSEKIFILSNFQKNADASKLKNFFFSLFPWHTKFYKLSEYI